MMMIDIIAIITIVIGILGLTGCMIGLDYALHMDEEGDK